MTQLPDDLSTGVRQWVERAVSPRARIVQIQRLVGGITSVVHLVDLELGGELRQVVLKRWMEGDLAERCGWIDREAQVLQVLESAGVEAPRYVASIDGTETGDVPALVMSRLPGEVCLTPRDPRAWLRQMAAALARLHAAQPPDLLPAAQPPTDGVDTPPDSQQPELWDRVAELLDQPAPAGVGMVHGDYQHFNVLWQRDVLTGIVDWTWAGVGHPDRDVGHCQLNLAVLFTPAWAEEFTVAYESESGRSTDRWWTVHEVSRYGGDDWQDFIPIQVAGRAAVAAAGMTARVEAVLRGLLR